MKVSGMFNRHCILALVCCLLSALSSDLSAQTNSHFTVDTWTVKRGELPQGEIIAMTQTRDGYLWLGTQNGLVRFDGLRFNIFNEVNTVGLEDNQIVHLFEDSRSNLWIGTLRAGVELMKDGVVKRLGIGGTGRERKLMSACEDGEGSVWLYTADGLLTRAHNGKTNFWLVTAGLDRMSVCRSIIAEKSGLIWVGTDRRMFGINPKADLGNDLAVQTILDVSGLQFLLASATSGYWRVAGGRVQKWTGDHLMKDLGLYPWKAPVVTACEDYDGNLIVGTQGDGVWWFNSSGTAEHLPSGERGLTHDYILSLVMDREGSLWVGTDGGGLNRVKKQVFTVVPGTEGLTVQSAYNDGSGGVWMCTRDHIRCWKDGVLKRYGANEGLQNPNGQVIFVDTNHTIWAGFVGSRPPFIGPLEPNLYQFHNDHFEVVSDYSRTNNQQILVLFQDSKRRIWAGTQGGLACYEAPDWKVFTTRDGLSSDIIQAISEAADGSLWIGTGNGLNRFQNGHFTSFHVKDGLPDEDVSSLFIDADQILWAGTRGHGLGRFADGKWTAYTSQQGLVSDSISYLIEDAETNLWMGSPSGLIRVRKAELNSYAAGVVKSVWCRAYGQADGLLTGECTSGSQPAACKTRDGRLWLPTIRGLATVDPAQIRFNTNPPPVVIEDVSIVRDDESAASLGPQLPVLVTVPAGRERVDIRFTSLNLSAAKESQSELRYRYRMDNYEAGWTEVDGNTRSVHYSKLPPGNYRFQVTACNEDGVWNPTGASLAFVVETPYWRTWWFISAIALCAMALVAAVVHNISSQRMQRQLENMRQQQALEKERARIARDLHDQLGASMTQVSLLGEMVETDKNDPAEVTEHARQISQTARDTSKVLDEIVWTVNPSNDTLDGLINYICKYAQEYFAVAGLRYRLDVPQQLPETEIAPELRHNVFLAAKEAITNVVRHAKATEVWLRLRIEPNKIVLEIQDNGRGPSGQETKSSRNGLRNMHKRMEDVGGSFELSAAPEGGAIARLTIPAFNKH